MNISIRLLVAYIMLCFAAAQSISQILVFSLNTKDELITKEQQYLAQYMSIAQSSINFFSAQNDIQGINNQLGALITTHNISEAILIDTEHNIIASADRTHIHKFVADVLPNLSDKTIKKTARTLQGEIQNIKECNCFISTYPVTQKDSNKITPTEQNILIVKYSYDLALQTAYYDTEQTLILNLIFIIFVTALLWISFHRVITAKINQLVGITENIAKGNLSTRTNIVGNNELGRLGNSINEMAAALHENNKQLHFQQRALDSHSIVAITNAQGIITFVNEKFCEISQYSKDELIGSTHKIVNSGLHPKSFFSDLWRTIASGKVWHGEVINKKKNGELYYLETTIVPFLNDQNVPFQYIAIRTDTSKIKETEKQLKQAQKMETMGLLTGGIAHDFNNILASILGYTELSLLKLNIQEVDKVPSYLDQVRHASERARNLIAQMLMFSKIDTERDRTANVFTVTNEVKQLLVSTLPANIQINTDISMGLPDISISPTKLLQVLMNLCINARDAIGEHGLIDITANLNNSTDLTCSACHQQFTGEHIIINISDNGDGIDGNLISKIFDPFFTTKGTEKGTGVGLAITRDIVHEADGHIVIKSSNEGTVFQLCFPPLSHEQQSLLQLPENTFDSLNGDNQHILIVDDEAMIAQFEAELLTSHGYQASTDIDSTRVLRMFNSNPDQFDLFIIDQTMPSLNGIDLAKSILERRPDAPIIICTGYSESVNEEIAKQAGVQGFLSKPIDSVTLLKLIRELLTKN